MHREMQPGTVLHKEGAINQVCRVLWTRAHLRWTERQWTRVLWSDESTFQLILVKQPTFGSTKKRKTIQAVLRQHLWWYGWLPMSEGSIEAEVDVGRRYHQGDIFSPHSGWLPAACFIHTECVCVCVCWTDSTSVSCWNWTEHHEEKQTAPTTDCWAEILHSATVSILGSQTKETFVFHLFIDVVSWAQSEVCEWRDWKQVWWVSLLQL